MYDKFKLFCQAKIILGVGLKKKMPLLADGSIVGDYEPLMIYVEIAKTKNPRAAEECMPRSEDFEWVRNYINIRGRSTVHSLLEALTARICERVDPEVAREALEKAYSTTFNSEDARERIAKIISGWIIEASRSLGYISY